MTDQIGESQNAEGQKTPDIKELLERIEKLEGTNTRLLGESKTYKAKAQTALTQLEEIEKSKLEKEGNYQQLLEAEREKQKKFMEEFNSLKQKTLKANIVNKISKYASDAVDIEDVVNQPKYATILQKGIIDLDLDDDVAKEYVQTVFEAKPWLKKNSVQVGAITKRPGYIEPTTKDPSTMTSQEIEDVLKSKFN